MKTMLYEPAPKIKSRINSILEESKERIRKIVDSNTKLSKAALDTNKKIVDSIKEKFQEQEIEADILFINSLRKNFPEFIEFSEDGIDGIIDAYFKQIQFNVNYNSKLVDAIKESGNNNTETLLQMIQENFEVACKVTTDTTSTIIESYNKHIDLALDFNKKMGENLCAGIENFKEFQAGYNLPADWWEIVQEQETTV